MNVPKEPAGHPEIPFDLTGYTCFSAINCPVEQAVQLLKEYQDICTKEHPSPFPFRITSLPENVAWSILCWPKPGEFYDLMNLTMWLMGYRAGLGGENPIFIALPPTERAHEGPMLARPEYDNPFGDEMLGYWHGWSFDYAIPTNTLRWIGKDVFPQEYFFNGRGYSSTGFQVKWLENLDSTPEWTECSIQLETPSVLKGS